jgi:hypothetical protein
MIWSLHRCVQLAWSSGPNNASNWGDVITKFKDGLLSAFDSAISQREDEVKRSESQRAMPGWNFCTFFILKARRRLWRLCTTSTTHIDAFNYNRKASRVLSKESISFKMR